MATPQILADIVRLLIQLLPAMALLCLVFAGVALRLEGGSTFLIGGGFTKWILWCVIMLPSSARGCCARSTRFVLTQWIKAMCSKRAPEACRGPLARTMR